MRYFLSLFCLFIYLAPASALAGSGYEVQQEQGVVIYRGQHPVSNFQAMAAAQAAAQQREQTRQQAAQQRENERALAALRRENAALAMRANKPAQPVTKSRYGRTYSGNNRFFGPNGFAGNSYFSGASPRVKTRRAHPRRSRY